LCGTWEGAMTHTTAPTPRGMQVPSALGAKALMRCWEWIENREGLDYGSGERAMDRPSLQAEREPHGIRSGAHSAHHCSHLSYL
jgi:hypothetical protein